MRLINKLVVALATSALMFTAAGENAIEYVERNTAELLKMKLDRVGEWDHEKGRIAVVGFAALENKKPEEIIARRPELAEAAIMNAKMKLAEKLGFSLSAEEKQHLWGESSAEKETAGITTSSKIRFLAKHRIYGATVLLQSESLHEGEYLMAVSLVWSLGLQRSAVATMSGSGKAAKSKPGKYSLEEWVEKRLNPVCVVGPRQYVDNQGKRHFIGIVSMPYDKKDPPAKRLMLERMLKVKGASMVAWSLRSDVETSAAAMTMLKQESIDGKETSEVSSELVEQINQRFRGALPPVADLFDEGCIYREHPMFPGSMMAVYACELDGEFMEYQRK